MRFLAQLSAVVLALGASFPQSLGAQNISSPPLIDPSASPANEPLLPDGEGFPIDINHYENPLLLFESQRQALPRQDEDTMDLLPPLEPLLPGRKSPAVPSEKPLTPAELKLRSLGLKVAASVVSLRVWDEFGAELSSGVGTFVTEDGIILTDTGLVHPEIVEKIDYITATGADGVNHKLSGFYTASLTSGVTLLQSAGTDCVPLQLAVGVNFAIEAPCHVLAVSERRGLVLADARIQRDPAMTGLGWLNLKGADSPGAVGSPVLAADGRVIGIVGMRVPLKDWMNFALPCDGAALELRKTRPSLQPLSKLPVAPKLREVAQDAEFVGAFQLLQSRRIEPALRKLMALAQKYPRSAECWALLGLCASHFGAGPEAVNCQRKAVALDPKAGLYWHQLALAKLREGGAGANLPATTEDREALELAVEQHPNDKLAWLLLASRHVRDGNLGQADEALSRVNLLAPDYAQGHYLKAYVRGRLKDYDTAQQSIQQSLKLNPGYAEAWYYQGLLLDKQKAHAEAAKAYRNAVRLKPDHPRAWLNLAHAYKRANRPNEARQAFQEHQKASDPRPR